MGKYRMGLVMGLDSVKGKDSATEMGLAMEMD